MTQKFFVDHNGVYLGAFIGGDPENAIEVSNAPPSGYARQRYDTLKGSWLPFPDEAEFRAAMPNISPRQLWLAAKSIDITKAQVLAMVDAIEDQDTKDTLYIELTEPPLNGFVRTSPSAISLAELMGVPPEQFDSLWVWAATIE